MGYVRVPRDLKSVKPKFIGPLNKRQAITIGLGIAAGAAGYYLSKPHIGAGNAIYVLVACMLPIVFTGLYEKDNRYIEDIIKDFINVKFKRPGIRVFESDNMYRYMHERLYLEEVLGINEKESQPGRKEDE